MSTKRHTDSYLQTDKRIVIATINTYIKRKGTVKEPSIRAVCSEAKMEWATFRYHFGNINEIFNKAEEIIKKTAVTTTNNLGKDIKNTRLSVFFSRLFTELRNENVYKYCELITRCDRIDLWYPMLDELRPILENL